MSGVVGVPGSEKRRMERFDLRLPAKVVASKEQQLEVLELMTEDVCAGGAFFHTEAPLPIGTEVKVDIVLPLDKLRQLRGKNALIKVTGAVIRVTKDGMAVCFEPNFEISSTDDI